MKNHIVIVSVAWSTDEYYTPKFIKLTFSDELIKKLEKTIEIAKEYEFDSCKIRHTEAEYFNDKSCRVENDFQSDVHQLIVFPDGDIVFYAQNKHDSSTQFESVYLTIDKIKSGLTLG